MSSRQGALTVIAPIAADREEDLRTLLAGIDGEIRGGTVRADQGATLPFGDVMGLHFARFVILERTSGAIGPRLLFSTDFDGRLADHLAELVRATRDGLERVLRNCTGYPDGAGDAKSVRSYIEAHRRDENTFYVGARCRTVGEILVDQQLSVSIRAFLGREAERFRGERAGAAEIRRAVLRHVAESRLFPSPDEPPAAPRRLWNLSHDLRALVLTLLVLLSPIVVAVLIVRALALPWVLWVPVGLAAEAAWLLPLFLALFVHERRDVSTDRQFREAVRHADKSSVVEHEDEDVLNEMTNLSEIKPGWLRMTLLRSVLGVADVLARHLSYKGELSGIPTIHFARWVIVPEDRRLVFLSNYDGSWESYLGDFVDQASVGLTAIWSNARGFPPTRGLVCGGARYEEPFKAIARACQIRTQVWYRAYPGISLQRILRNAEIHRGLFGEPDLEKTKEWLRLL